MDLTKIDLDKFLGKFVIEGCNGLEFCNYTSVIIESGIGEVLVELGEGYVIRALDSDPGDRALFFGESLVGFYQNELVRITCQHQRKQLSTPLILSAVKNRKEGQERKLTERGKKALVRAWNVANGKQANKRVENCPSLVGDDSSS
jgi:hypothetical protein